MDPLRYTLSFPAPHTHHVEVRAEIPTDRRAEVELMMAVWTPGPYLIREYERHVENVAAIGEPGSALAIRKSAKNRWTIFSGGSDRIVVTSRVYGRGMLVRTNWIESGFALISWFTGRACRLAWSSSRRSRTRSGALQTTLGRAVLELDPGATAAQLARLDFWLALSGISGQAG